MLANYQQTQTLKNMKKESEITELRLQQTFFLWSWNTYPEKRGLLFMLHNTPQNDIKGSQLIGAGMVRGVADLLLLKDNGRYLFIEVKLPGETQSMFQKWFEKLINFIRGNYIVCDSIEYFKEIYINNVASGVMPAMQVGKG
jgi:hypothetical protein